MEILAMQQPPESSNRLVRVAIVGAGPSGFYAAGSLLKSWKGEVIVDLFDRLPAPYGLVRYGVAPDHQKIKNVEKVYLRTAMDKRVSFFGNVEFGRDVNRNDLLDYYDQVVYAVGAQADRKLGIEGEDLAGSLSATEFVAWYNGHPDYCDAEPDVEVKTAVVVGVGNVAMDVARVLARTPEELATTDIADHALQQLRSSRIKDIYVLARRGPVQAKFSPPEIKEMGELENAEVVIDEAELELDPDSEKELENDTQAQKNLEILSELAVRKPDGKPRRVHFRFLVSPVEILGKESKVCAVRIEQNRLKKLTGGYLAAEGTGRFETLPAGLVLRSVGYSVVPLPGLVFDKKRRIIPNQKGRVIDPESGQVLPREYVVGWAKRGPNGLIGTNKGDAQETVEQMLEDAQKFPGHSKKATSSQDITDLLKSKNCRYFTFDDWLKIDQVERTQGKQQNRPRVKIVRREEMLRMLEA